MTEPLEYLFGQSWGQRVIIGTTLVVYGWLFFMDPAAAQRSAARGFGTLISLFTLIVASLLLASAAEQLIPEAAVTEHLGSESGARNTVLAGLLGGMLFGGPFATYPIIQSVRKQGAGYAVFLAMLVGYGVINIGRVPFGLVIFSPEIVFIRLVFAVVLTVFASLLIWAVVPEREGGIIEPGD